MEPWDSKEYADITYRLKGLGMAGAVLHIGAHPDDEDVGLLSYLSCKFGNRTVHLINRKPVEVRVNIKGQSQTFPTGQTWFGSVVGDDSSIGALCLLQPGTVIGQRCLVYPRCSVSGYIPSDSIVRPTSAPFEVIPR